MRLGTTVLAVWLAVLVGATGAFVALQSRGGNDLLRIQQARALRLHAAGTVGAAAVEAVVAQAPEPVAPASRTRPATVRCAAGSSGTLRDPWSCKIRYRSGTVAHYLVIIEPDGRYRGSGTGVIYGCCVRVPTAD